MRSKCHRRGQSRSLRQRVRPERGYSDTKLDLSLAIWPKASDANSKRVRNTHRPNVELSDLPHELGLLSPVLELIAKVMEPHEWVMKIGWLPLR